MSLLRRRAMYEAGELPAGYKRCKYLQSNNKQYIETGIYLKNTYVWDIVLQQVGTSGNGWIGSGVNSGACAGINTLNYGKISCSFGANSGWVSPVLSSIEPDFEKHSITLKSGLFIVDGAETITSEWASSINSNVVVTLFGFQTKWSNSAKSTVTGSKKIYSHKFTEAGIKFQEFIPALDESGTPCMYDVVSATPFYNKGSGTFGYELMDGTYVAPI